MAIETNVGSIIEDLSSTSEESKSNWFLILLIVSGWFAITLRTRLNSPEQIYEITLRAAFFYSFTIKLDELDFTKVKS